MVFNVVNFAVLSRKKKHLTFVGPVRGDRPLGQTKSQI